LSEWHFLYTLIDDEKKSGWGIATQENKNKRVLAMDWKEESGPGREQQLIQFLKNLGLIGGLLMVVIEKQEASM